MFGLFKTEDKQTSLLVDIGNGSIGAALVAFEKNKLPRFVYNNRIPFVLSEKSNAERLMAEMDTKLDEIIKNVVNFGSSEIKKTSKQKISSILVTFSSPWFLVKTKHLSLSDKKTFIITKSFLDSVLSQEETVFKKELAKDFSDTEGDAFSVIERSIVHTKINGYALNNSVGRKTKVFDAYVCMSAVLKTIEEKVLNALVKHTHLSREHIILHTFPLASFTVIRDIFIHDADFVMMDITSEITDLTVVNEGVIVHSVSFPSGRNFIIRQLARAMGVTLEIAESHLHLYTINKLDDPTSATVHATLLDVEKEWSIYLSESLSELAPHAVLPKKVFLTCDDDVADVFMEFLRLPKSDNTSMFRKNLNLTHIDHDTLSHYYEATPAMNVDEFLAILSIFYNKVLHLK